MRIIVGIDLQQAYEPALHLVGRLGLKDPELWIERMLIGSTSLHQVIDEPYNVLLLRP